MNNYCALWDTLCHRPNERISRGTKVQEKFVNVRLNFAFRYRHEMRNLNVFYFEIFFVMFFFTSSCGFRYNLREKYENRRNCYVSQAR